MQDENDDPVDAGYDAIESERRVHPAVLSPDGVAMVVVLAIDRGIKGIVGPRDHEEKPCDNGQDLISQQVG